MAICDWCRQHELLVRLQGTHGGIHAYVPCSDRAHHVMLCGWLGPHPRLLQGGQFDVQDTDCACFDVALGFAEKRCIQ